MLLKPGDITGGGGRPTYVLVRPVEGDETLGDGLDDCLVDVGTLRMGVVAVTDGLVEHLPRGSEEDEGGPTCLMMLLTSSFESTFLSRLSSAVLMSTILNRGWNTR